MCSGASLNNCITFSVAQFLRRRRAVLVYCPGITGSNQVQRVLHMKICLATNLCLLSAVTASRRLSTQPNLQTNVWKIKKKLVQQLI